ncbi:hypothetical protein V8Z74_17740 [Comamonas sp. w2-DMI]|uniref:hypothetical protein n=1 Tax=Comamonas sp. w2-DMI TaxID=3126391 RepID=UPI0032E36B56
MNASRGSSGKWTLQTGMECKAQQSLQLLRAFATRQAARGADAHGAAIRAEHPEDNRLLLF